MAAFDKECLQTFLENQHQLFKEPVAQSMGETENYLQEVMASVVNSKQEVKQYFEENGMDTSDMSLDEIVSQAEVFNLKKSGRYLIVEA